MHRSIPDALCVSTAEATKIKLPSTNSRTTNSMHTQTIPSKFQLWFGFNVFVVVYDCLLTFGVCVVLSLCSVHLQSPTFLFVLKLCERARVTTNQRTKIYLHKILKLKTQGDSFWKRFYLFRPQQCEHILIVIVYIFTLPGVRFLFLFRRFIFCCCSLSDSISSYLTIQHAFIVAHSAAASRIISKTNRTLSSNSNKLAKLSQIVFIFRRKLRSGFEALEDVWSNSEARRLKYAIWLWDEVILRKQCFAFYDRISDALAIWVRKLPLIRK